VKTEKILKHIAAETGFQEKAIAEKIENIKNNGPVVPFKLEIHVHEDCFCNCLFCINKEWRNQKNKKELEQANLDGNVLEKIVSEAKELNINSISFSGGGEPLLNPNTLQAIKKANSLGLSTKLVTNGVLLDEKAFGILLDCSHLRVSISAASEEKFQEVQNSDIKITLKELFDKVKNFIEKRNKLGKKVEVWLSYQIIKNNSTEIEKFVTLAENAGVDGILFEFPYCVRKELMCSEEEAKNAKKTIQETAEKHKNELKISFSEETLDYLENNEKRFSHCLAPYFKLTIASNGHIFPCCQMADQGGSNHRQYSLGRLDQKTGLKKILTSENAKEKVREINPKECPDCIPSELKINNFLGELKI